jgi:hypothetical protein
MRSETFALLGSGPSVNELTEHDYRLLEKYDTFALNFWGKNRFIPNYYMYEGSRDSERHQEFLDILDDREVQYRCKTIFFFKHVPWFYRHGNLADAFSSLPSSLLSRVRLFPIRWVKFRSRSDVILRKLNSQSMNLPVHQYKGSATAAVNWAVSRGYARILLIGVDLTSGSFHAGQTPDAPMHPTALTSSRELDLVSYFAELDQQLRSAGRCGIEVGSEASRLYPSLNLWDKSW